MNPPTAATTSRTTAFDNTIAITTTAIATAKSLLRKFDHIPAILML
jgi:hypothetical protein